MTHDEAFLQAILESPEDDTPRLVYADWLDEYGRSDRANFIRIQCELEKVPPGHLPPPVLDRRERTRDTVRSDARAELARRATLLLRKYGKKWAGPLSGMVHRWEFRRGFVEAVELGAGTFLGHAGELFRLAPIRHVWLTGAYDHLDALLRTPYLRRLTGLDLSWNYFYRDHAKRWTALLTSSRLKQLRTLRLEKTRGGGTLADATFRALLRTTHFKHLTELDLMDQGLGDRHIKALAAWPCLAKVRRLDLTGNEFTQAGAKALARSPYLGNLAELNLSHTDIGDAGWGALLASPNLADLSWLGIDDAWLSEEMEQALIGRYGEEKLDRAAGY
jgi:uncharacterized protein (TIGR02996 family)